MHFQPKSCVWELTMACNMRCGHCGSSCAEKLPGELNTREALNLCDDLISLGIQKVTLSGGEPLLREDWPHIAHRFSSHGVSVNMITNGWLVNEQVIELAKDSGIDNIGMSLDGLEKSHDTLRKRGAFARVIAALKMAQKSKFPTAVVTTLLQSTIDQLPLMREILEEFEVVYWQMQIGLPMGNLKKIDVIHPWQLASVIEFLNSLVENSSIKPYPADSIGYHTKQMEQLWKAAWKGCCWSGCQAGKSNIGILHDGSIVGCTSIRDSSYQEGTIQDTPLHEIWNRDEAFSWNRSLSRADLTGFCRKCKFAGTCLGGCANTKLTMTGALGDNPYCAYRDMVEGLYPKIDAIRDVSTLLARAGKAIDLDLIELAEKCAQTALDLEPDNVEALKLKAFTAFKLCEYETSLKVNRHALQFAPNDPYIHKGIGICLSKTGRVDEGINSLEKAIELSDESFLDPYLDLAVVLYENDQTDKALKFLETTRNSYPDFRPLSESIYREVSTLHEASSCPSKKCHFG